jgi:hypothetical protein
MPRWAGFGASAEARDLWRDFSSRVERVIDVVHIARVEQPTIGDAGWTN